MISGVMLSISAMRDKRIGLVLRALKEADVRDVEAHWSRGNRQYYTSGRKSGIKRVGSNPNLYLALKSVATKFGINVPEIEKVDELTLRRGRLSDESRAQLEAIEAVSTSVKLVIRKGHTRARVFSLVVTPNPDVASIENPFCGEGSRLESAINRAHRALYQESAVLDHNALVAQLDPDARSSLDRINSAMQEQGAVIQLRSLPPVSPFKVAITLKRPGEKPAEFLGLTALAAVGALEQAVSEGNLTLTAKGP